MIFDYELPKHLIAQQPMTERDASRLMVLHRSTQHIEHRIFRELIDYLRAGDLLVLNDTRVLPARLFGHREKTGGKWEGLFIRRRLEDGLWEMMAQSGGKPEVGETIVVEPGELRLHLRGRADRFWLVEPEPLGEPEELLVRHGRLPLPPYIRKGVAEETDSERYQTVFAQTSGSIAAPTAGLHFTPQLLERIRAMNVNVAYCTLHVGLGTFEPIRTDDPLQHTMHREWASVPSDTANAIRSCKANGGRVIGVGTTVTRTLETAAREGNGEVIAWSGETDLYIHPPFEFRALDGLITNFHLPQTTLLLLVGALAGMDLLKEAYRLAVEREYRFYSYGDAMLIV